MSRSLRTPMKSAAGLGAAKHGADHFIKQRVSAIALVVLAVWFVFALVATYRQGYEAARAWLAQPVTAIAMALFVTAAFYHMRLGLQVVIEDYIAKPGTRAALLILNFFVAATLWAASIFSILKIAISG